DVYELYQRRLFAANAVDFDDMLFLTVDVLERFPEAREKWQKAFRYILVDEYQDTNHAQYRFLQLLAEKHSNVFAVGDPDSWPNFPDPVVDQLYIRNYPTSATYETGTLVLREVHP
ncbi:hypothetical protein B4Q13_15560, partial [Lacticaseibacillus rhamnosus]